MPESIEKFIDLVEAKISTLPHTSDLAALSTVLATLKRVVTLVEADLNPPEPVATDAPKLETVKKA